MITQEMGERIGVNIRVKKNLLIEEEFSFTLTKT